MKVEFLGTTSKAKIAHPCLSVDSIIPPRFGENSCAADQQACVFGSCECNKHSVLKIFMINGQSFQIV